MAKSRVGRIEPAKAKSDPSPQWTSGQRRGLKAESYFFRRKVLPPLEVPHGCDTARTVQAFREKITYLGKMAVIRAEA